MLKKCMHGDEAENRRMSDGKQPCFLTVTPSRCTSKVEAKRSRDDVEKGFGCLVMWADRTYVQQQYLTASLLAIRLATRS